MYHPDPHSTLLPRLSLATTLSGLPLSSCLMNASGPLCTTFDELNALYSSEFTGAVVTKSCTLESRQGNPEPRYFTLPLGSISTNGLCNLGYKEYINFGNQLLTSSQKRKPYIISVSGMSLQDNLTILKELNTSVYPDSPGTPEKHNYSHNLVEFNLSCPNLSGKSIVGYDFPSMEETLRKITEAYTERIGLKLPPYFDMSHFQQASDIIKQHPTVTFVTCINAVGNGLYVSPETDSTVVVGKESTPFGFGAIGGQYCKPTALANVHAFFRELGSKKDVIGCGGVSSGQDAYEHILCGATAVQIGTALYEDGVDVFKKCQEEFLELMTKKGYSSIDELKGKLKYVQRAN